MTPSTTCSGSSFRRGFSLMEVLVVVSVIALLIAMLLPALSHARRQGRRMGCVANLRATGNALNLIKTERGRYPVPEGPPRVTGLANIGQVAKQLVQGPLGDPRAMFCPISTRNDPYSKGPFLRLPGGGVMNHWETGQISFLYLAGVADAFPDAAGVPTFVPAVESPDQARTPRAVLLGDRTVELAPNRRNIAGSNHGHEGGWFYFTGGNVRWYNWDQLTAHPTNVYIWYWPRTAGSH